MDPGIFSRELWYTAIMIMLKYLSEKERGRDLRLCYIVYREDNVPVFDSQVLEYLKALRSDPRIQDIELVVFRHDKNLLKKSALEKKIREYVPNCRSFISFPVLSMAQLRYSALRMLLYVCRYYSRDDEIAVICRGDLAAYVGTRAFRGFPNSRVLYDNRGLAYEESEMAHPRGWIHRVNREKKRAAMLYAKDHCDIYNFVTWPMREYFLERYHYHADLPYTVIPTLFQLQSVEPGRLEEIRRQEGLQNGEYVIVYVGSAAAWQCMDTVLDAFRNIYGLSQQVRFFVLTWNDVPGLDRLDGGLCARITVKGVPHSDIPYYLAIANVGIVIRDDSIVNKVAAPTKIAEYLTAGMKILFRGDIGIIRDLQMRMGVDQLICMDREGTWIDELRRDMEAPARHRDHRVEEYFDMEARQKETIQMLLNSFKRAKVG